MRKLVLKMSMSLDGFVCGPNGEMDWTIRSRSDDSSAWVLETLRQAGVHALGHQAYREIAGYWPSATIPMAAPMNETPKIVFTRQAALDPVDWLAGPEMSPAAIGWASPRVASGDLVDEIQRLKQEPGKDILAHGGAEFARNLVRFDLVDEYRLVIHPIALGSGRPLFSGLQRPMDLELVDIASFRGGVVAHVYHPIREE